MQHLPKKLVTLREPRINVIIENPRTFGTSEPIQIETEGLLDTGATLVLIPPAMAIGLKLSRIGRRDIDTPGRRQRGWIYDAIVSVPMLSQRHEVQVASLIGADEPGPDERPLVLLGKSLLQHFHFCMLGPEGEFTLSVPGGR